MRRQVATLVIVASIICVASSSSFVFAADAIAKSSNGKQASPAGQESAEAAALVKQALVAEAAGDDTARSAYLRQALAADPGYAPAHWQLGEVRVNDRWLDSEDAAHENEWSGRFVKYRELRDQAPATVDGQLQLARWCKDQGLADQEKVHLQNALQLQPTKAKRAEVVNKLGLVRYRKRLMPAATAEALKKQAKETEAALENWKPIVTRLRGDLESRDVARQNAAAQQLKEIRDVAVIPALEAGFSKATPMAGLAAVAALAEMPQQAATDSLVLQAVLAKHDEVRKAAAEALKLRDPFCYVPYLLSQMHALIEVNFQVGMTEGGALQERLSLFQEEQLWNRSYVSMAATLPRVPLVAQYQLGAQTAGGSSTTTLVVPDATPSIQATLRQADVDAVVAQNALSANAQQGFLNGRIAATLRTATGNLDFDDDPKGWWDWWTTYNETHYGPKETYEQNRYSYTQAAAAYAVTQNRPAQPADVHSCFVPGTLVWTVTGTVPIEKVQVADWVLAQNVETGELAYKPVEAVTKGPPLPLVEIHAGEETIRCTLGHLFWVSGTGWRMAKELKVGDRLHTTKGTLAIDSVVKKGEASCHNLVVPDFNTYFVTDQQILVHDIDVRGPTTATVPGLVEK